MAELMESYCYENTTVAYARDAMIKLSVAPQHSGFVPARNILL